MWSLTDYLVGTGGWAYFKVSGKPKLKAYSEVFNFVEVNYTFYEYPDQCLKITILCSTVDITARNI